MTRRGFTLVEMMVAGTILVSITLVATVWLTGVLDLWSTSTTQTEVRIEAQQALNRLVDELMSATRTSTATPPNATIPAAPNNDTITFYLPTDVDGNGTIIDAIGTIEYAAPAVPVQYVYVPGQQRLQRVEGATTTILANDVTAVTFEDVNIDPTLSINEVKITLNVQRTTSRGRTVSANAVEIVKLRN